MAYILQVPVIRIHCMLHASHSHTKHRFTLTCFSSFVRWCQ